MYIYNRVRARGDGRKGLVVTLTTKEGKVVAYGELKERVDYLKELVHHHRWPMAPDYGEKLTPLMDFLVEVQEEWVVPTILGRKVAERWNADVGNWGPERIQWILSLRKYVEPDPTIEETARDFLAGLWRAHKPERIGLPEFLSSLKKRFMHQRVNPTMEEFLALSFYFDIGETWAVKLRPLAYELFDSATEEGITWRHTYAEGVDGDAFLEALKERLELPGRLWIWAPRLWLFPSRCDLYYTFTVKAGRLWIEPKLSYPVWLFYLSPERQKEILQRRGLTPFPVEELPVGYDIGVEKLRLRADVFSRCLRNEGIITISRAA